MWIQWQAWWKQNWIGPVEYLTACITTQQLGGSFGGMPPKENFSNLMLYDCFWSHFWTLLQLYLELLAGFDSDMISLQHNHLATCSSTFFPRPRQHEICAAVQAMNAAAIAELCYISLALPALSLQVTSTVSLACTSMRPFEKSQKLVQPWPEQPDQLCRPWMGESIRCSQQRGWKFLHLHTSGKA